MLCIQYAHTCSLSDISLRIQRCTLAVLEHVIAASLDGRAAIARIPFMYTPQLACDLDDTDSMNVAKLFQRGHRYCQHRRLPLPPYS